MTAGGFWALRLIDLAQTCAKGTQRRSYEVDFFASGRIRAPTVCYN